MTGQNDGASIDFFVSYAPPDLQWAEWIAWNLENEGYVVRLHAWDHAMAGTNSILAANTSIRAANRVIAVLSPNYHVDPRSQSEWSAVFRADPINAQRRLLPVEIEATAKGGLLEALEPVIVHGVREDEAKHRLREGVLERRLRPTNAPGFPGRAAPAFPGTKAMRGDTRMLIFLWLLFGSWLAYAYSELPYEFDNNADLQRSLVLLILLFMVIGTSRRWWRRRF
ncbi:hypothetical protein FRAHR75_210025 [Frankia sp. Hr75.2]|nr:hypothetical protein FRAHR75_210025 [Frankia sp. Hr75.2]